MSSASLDICTSSYPIWTLISLFWLSVVARTSNTMKVWTKLARVGTLVFEELLSVFIIEYYISCRLIVRGFYYVELCSIYSHIVESFFNHKWTSNFVKCFFFIFWDDHVVLPYILLIWCSWFFMCLRNLHFWDKFHFVVME